MTTTPRCRHIKTNGLTCKSPALRGELRCFYHRGQMLRHSRFNSFSNPPGLVKRGEHMPLIPIDDHDSVQLALSMVINGLAIGHLEPTRAKALLYGLQIAANNAKNTKPEPSNRHDLPLAIHTDHAGDDLAQPGDTVDVTDPVVAFQEEEDERRARKQSTDDDDDDEEDDYEEDDEDEEDDYDEDDEEDDDDDEEEENLEDEEEDEDLDDEDEEDDLRVFNEVNDFMRRHP
jgi:hypothetical protein